MKQKVILTILDGCRPDGIAQAATPHIDVLWQTGAYTWTAQSVMPTITLPAHMSMLRGVAPGKHGVTNNIFQPSASAFPSIIDVAHQAGLHTAMFYDWEELRDLSTPGSLNFSLFRDYRPGEPTGAGTAEAAAAYLADEQPDLCILYLGATDEVGHQAGWMSPPYLQAIAEGDKAIGRVLTALDAADLEDAYTLIVTSDHGGDGHMHGGDVPAHMNIPWIINGAGVKRGYLIQAPVAIYDTAATIAYLLGVPQPEVWEGRPVYDAFA
ncbi:MAG: alkaline phosphatase family protein [Anaerolineae bacterium]|nr:alkaline phosphatase family protein [Anaerolineae bacterium]